MHHILIVEDEPKIALANQKYLEFKGYSVVVVYDSESAEKILREQQFDCIVLDIMLPDGNGLDLCKKIRRIVSTPILFLSALDTHEDILQGLLSGGDDYMTKPFSLEEMKVRISALIRRNTLYTFRLDKKSRSLVSSLGNIRFSEKEFALLLLLIETDGVVAEKRLEKFVDFDSNMLAVYIRRLRKKLEPVEQWVGKIETVYGQGYLLNQKIPIS